jgi:hypothetical protein
MTATAVVAVRVATVMTIKRLEKSCCSEESGEGNGVIITGLVFSRGAVDKEICNVVVVSPSAPQPDCEYIGEHPIAITCSNPARLRAAFIRLLVRREAMALASCSEEVAMLKSTRTASASSFRRAEI